MKRREFLLLADTLNPEKHDPVGMLMSEKLDGNRVWWDGGVSRGVPTVDVPWASIYEKDGKTLKNKIKPVATGLWTRYGNPVAAPEEFLDALPQGEPFDGELYAGHGKFQYVQSASRCDVADPEKWEGLAFHAFGCPAYGQVLQDGHINLSGNVVYNRVINQTECLEWVAGRLGIPVQALYDQPVLPFHEELDKIEEIAIHNNNPLFVPVPHTVCVSMAQVLDLAKQVSDAGGEGMMLRDESSVWEPKRKTFLLKVKPRHTSEATIIGFVSGRKGKTGQLLGKLGCLVVRWEGDEHTTFGMTSPVEFELGTGLTHADRELLPGAEKIASALPGQLMDGLAETAIFKLGDVVEFSYRELSDDGIPKEGSYLRIRNDN